MSGIGVLSGCNGTLIQRQHSATDRGPRVLGHSRRAGLPSQFIPQASLGQHTIDGGCELLGGVRYEDVASVNCIQSFAPDRCTDDRHAHRPCIENLETTSATDPERCNIAARALHYWTNVIDIAR